MIYWLSLPLVIQIMCLISVPYGIAHACNAWQFLPLNHYYYQCMAVSTIKPLLLSIFYVIDYYLLPIAQNLLYWSSHTKFSYTFMYDLDIKAGNGNGNGTYI